mgnify:CR=1 FL=1
MYYDEFETGFIGALFLVGDEKGLNHIGFQHDQHPVLLQPDWKRNPDFFSSVKSQLKEYFDGKRMVFDLPIAPEGTPFQLKVWQALQLIPYGELISYKSIAQTIGNPKAVRAVGGANRKNPIPIIVPCHRVIGSDNSLTGYGGGLEIKKRLIDLERQTVSKAR